MPQYAALDISNDVTVIHVIDEAGFTRWRGGRTDLTGILDRSNR